MSMAYSRVAVWLSVLGFVLGLTASCVGGSGNGCARAIAGCRCYPNGTCESGYTCGNDDLCTGGGNGPDASVGSGNGNGGVGGFGGSSGGSNSSGSNAGGTSAGGGVSFDCEPGWNDCGAGCINTADNPLHCGGCNQPCELGQVCNGGLCQDGGDCTATPCIGFSYCDLVDKLCKPGCGSNVVCATNQECNLNTHACVCAEGFHDCQGNCVANDDPNTCGTSCTPCPAVGGGVATCDGTQCGALCNDPNAIQCGGSCYATAEDACGPSCEPCGTVENGSISCIGGSCQSSCNATYQPYCERCYASNILTAPNAGNCTTSADCCDELPQTFCNQGGFCVRPYEQCATNIGCAEGQTCMCIYGDTFGPCQAPSDVGYCAPSCQIGSSCPRYLPNEYPDTTTHCASAGTLAFKCHIQCVQGLVPCPAGWGCSPQGACYRY